jgi:hypothetical protein
MGNFLAAFFGVVHGDLTSFCGALAKILRSGNGIVAGNRKHVFGSVGSFHRDGLAVFSDLCDRALNRFHPVFAELIEPATVERKNERQRQCGQFVDRRVRLTYNLILR